MFSALVVLRSTNFIFVLQPVWCNDLHLNVQEMSPVTVLMSPCLEPARAPSSVTARHKRADS